ncbi:PLP-dependent cysteine synthase family protein [Poseidonocella sp. HB161398]|uniref:PLP-dependent cysteine synthase family protein n=1 Tax=Poseidonocella sp. HB161398 TaxID=2320855 RepID=UPI0011094891|nr:pyridoxal-phosphate dependent enzyme [Poseidonocella sp. HB161398]
MTAFPDPDRPDLRLPAGSGTGHCPSLQREAPRDWIAGALARLRAEAEASAPTPLCFLSPKGRPDLRFAFKDESRQPTGSLKHRLARSLFVSGLCSGEIGPDTPLVEASSGSTAISEAWFARMLGLRFIAVIPRGTSPAKIEAIRAYGGDCHLVADPATVYDEARRLAQETGGVYLDQFGNAANVTDWRRDNIAQEFLAQLAASLGRLPDWLVMGAGTGGTATTMGRYIRYLDLPVRLCIADVEFSAFFEGVRRDDPAARCDRASRIEGVGRPRMEPSFLPGVVDQMLKVPDDASVAAMHVLSDRLGRPVGASTGAAFYAACDLAARGRQEPLSVFGLLICDSGTRYRDTYFSPDWLARSGIEIAGPAKRLERFLDSGTW